MGHVRQAGQTRDNPNPIGELLGKRGVLLSRFVQNPGKPFQNNALHAKTLFNHGPHRLVTGFGNDPRDVAGKMAERIERDASAPEFVTKIQQRALAPGLVVHQTGDPPDLGHALDFNTCPALDTDVDILACGPVAGADLPRAATKPAYDLRHVGRLLGCPHIGLGNGFDQRHTQTIRQKDAIMPNVRHLTAGVFLQPELPDTDLAIFVRNPAVHTDDRRALEPGGDRAVKVLLPGYV